MFKNDFKSFIQKEEERVLKKSMHSKGFVERIEEQSVNNNIEIDSDSSSDSSYSSSTEQELSERCQKEHMNAKGIKNNSLLINWDSNGNEHITNYKTGQKKNNEAIWVEEIIKSSNEINKQNGRS